MSHHRFNLRSTLTLPRTSAVRALGAAGGALALAAVLAACSGADHDMAAMSPGSSASTSSGAPITSGAAEPDPAAVASASSAVSAEHDDADVSFAQQMIVHHQGAVQMAELAQARAEDPAVRELAARIQAAQTPEIAQMTGWLRAWGAPEATAEGEHAGHDTGSDMGSIGMSAQDMSALEQASGTEFDVLFLQQMAAHHQGAVDMAEAQLSDGVNPQAVELAEAVVASQTAEIQEMEQMLRTLQA